MNLFLVCLGISLGLAFYALLPQSRKKRLNLFFYILLIAYIMMVVTVTLTPIFFLEPMSLDQLMNFVNVIPLGNNQGGFIGLQEFSQCIMNAIMFMPLGILLPLTLKRKLKIRYFLIICFGFSMTIETIQLLGTYMGIMMRSFDINDLIFNTLGGTFTYSFFSFIFECIQKNYQIENSIV